MVKNIRLTENEQILLPLISEQAIGSVVARAGISRTDFSCLIAGYHISESSIGFTVKKVASTTSLNKYTVYRTFKRLEDLRMIRKIRKAAGPYQRRYSAVYCISTEGMILLKRYTSNLRRLSNQYSTQGIS